MQIIKIKNKKIRCQIIRLKNNKNNLKMRKTKKIRVKMTTIFDRKAKKKKAFCTK